jgi:hypothetical protein
MASALVIDIDPKRIARIQAKLRKMTGKSLSAQLDKAMYAVGDLLVPPLKAASPRVRGTLRKSIRTKRRTGRGGMLYEVGPMAPHRYLVIHGTRPHSLATKRSGRSTFSAFADGNVRRTSALRHPGSRGNPFVERVRAQHESRARDIVRKQIWWLYR